MAKNFQLIHLTVDDGRFNKANNRLRNQFVGCMHAHLWNVDQVPVSFHFDV
jgi:hypothetical protein